MIAVVENDRPLRRLLALASPDELAFLADILTDGGKGRLALAENVKQKIVEHRATNSLNQIADLLEAEICGFGGNTIINTIRSNAVDYKEIVADVATRLGADVEKFDGIFEIEEKLIQALLADALDGMGAEERQTFLKLRGLGLADEVVRKILDSADTQDMSRQIMLALGVSGAGQLVSTVIRNMIFSAGAAVGIASTGVATAIGTRVIAVAGNPVLGAIAGLAAIYQAAGPAYRVTIPAVAHIACIRRAQVDCDFNLFSRRLHACL